MISYNHRMALSLDEVAHIASLARLQLSPAEQAQFREQLSAVLNYMESLRQVDTAAVAPLASVLALQTVLRADEPLPSLPPGDLLAGAADAEAGMFRVPPVLD